jgi:Ca-activated chloride channel homolog
MHRKATLPILLLSSFLLISPASADGTETDANIITGLDVSDSISTVETQLQIDGMARAIRDPEIIAAIQRGRHQRIGFAVFAWADGDYPVLVSWRSIGSEADARAAADEMSARLKILTQSAGTLVGSLTDLSSAMDYGFAMLGEAPYAADRQVLNIIGNGEDNVGEDPRRARDGLVSQGITINGVVLGNNPALVEYYRATVIGGPTAFVLSVNSADSLTEVFARKFVSEIVMNVEAIDRNRR